jgi:protein AbiQ
MKFYNIKDDYILFLKKYDAKVAENKKESRPYVGVVFEVDGIKYYAPFTSPKAKHQRMKNGKDFRKISQGKYGAINFNNMIPVPDDALLLKDIENEPNQQYRRLLQNQYQAIKEDWTAIKKTAENLRKLVLTADEELGLYNRQIKSRCCNLTILESVYMEYKPIEEMK